MKKQNNTFLRVAVPLPSLPSQKIGEVERAVLAREYASPWAGVSRANPTDPFGWCFCKLCSQSTEFAVAIDAIRVFKRLERDNAKSMPITQDMRDAAQYAANVIVGRFEEALNGQHGQFEIGRMIVAFGAPLGASSGSPIELRNQLELDSFRDHIERKMLISAWQTKEGALRGAIRLRGQSGKERPSKLYCSMHYPRRSDDARRAYQRDRKFAAEYQQLISDIWSQYPREYRAWCITDHKQVRELAYSSLQAMKAPTRLIGTLQSRGIENQAEMARQLGISRQAVSAANKRRNRIAKS